MKVDLDYRPSSLLLSIVGVAGMVATIVGVVLTLIIIGTLQSSRGFSIVLIGPGISALLSGVMMLVVAQIGRTVSNLADMVQAAPSQFSVRQETNAPMSSANLTPHDLHIKEVGEFFMVGDRTFRSRTQAEEYLRTQS